MNRRRRNGCDIYLERAIEDMPVAKDVEEATLQILSNGTQLDYIFRELDEDCFFSPKFRLVFLTAKDLYKRTGTVSYDKLVEEVGEGVLSFGEEGLTYNVGSLEYYIKILISYKIRRTVIRESANLIREAFNDYLSIDDFIKECKSFPDRVIGKHVENC